MCVLFWSYPCCPCGVASLQEGPRFNHSPALCDSRGFAPLCSCIARSKSHLWTPSLAECNYMLMPGHSAPEKKIWRVWCVVASRVRKVQLRRQWLAARKEKQATGSDRGGNQWETIRIDSGCSHLLWIYLTRGREGKKRCRKTGERGEKHRFPRVRTKAYTRFHHGGSWR